MTTTQPESVAPQSPRAVERETALPMPPGQDAQDIVWRQLVEQFTLYDKAAFRNRLGYQILKVLTLLLGGTVTILAAINSPPGVTAALAAAVVASEGVQQLLQLHANWISYRRNAEALRREAFAYAAEVSPYADPATRRARLAAAVQAIVSAENAAWTKAMQQPRPA